MVEERERLEEAMERMFNIVSFAPANRVIVTEPGVLNQSIQDTAKPHGFFWPPDPSSAAFSTVGGNIATSAGGPHAAKYGTTREHVLFSRPLKLCCCHCQYHVASTIAKCIRIS